MVVDSKLYAALEAAHDADTPTLRDQFRALVLKHHPVKSQSPESRERFHTMCWALEVLTDPERRHRYDSLGSAAVEPPANFDPLDVFGVFFGARPRRGRRKPPDTVHELPTSLEDFYNGRHPKLTITRDRTCIPCDGRGTRDEGVSVRCSDCSASGVRSVVRQIARGYIQQVQVPCAVCSGSGRIIRVEDRCPDCSGQGITRERKVFEVNVLPGMHSGQHFTFQGEGDQMPGMELAGDVIIILTEKRHDRFARRGNHLLLTYELTLSEALCGFALVIEHLDGRQLVIQPARGQVVSPNCMWQVDGEGMVVQGSAAERGHLLIRFQVEFPQRISDTDAEVLSQLFGRRPQPLVAADSVECWLKPAETGLFDRSAAAQIGDVVSTALDSRKAAACAHQ